MVSNSPVLLRLESGSQSLRRFRRWNTPLSEKKACGIDAIIAEMIILDERELSRVILVIVDIFNERTNDRIC